jgi:hypothetical protein
MLILRFVYYLHDHTRIVTERLIHPTDIGWLITIGFCTVPVVGLFHATYYNTQYYYYSPSSYSSNYPNKKGVGHHPPVVPYNDTNLLYLLAEGISQIAQIAIVVYMIRYLVHILIEFGYNSTNNNSTMGSSSSTQ